MTSLSVIGIIYTNISDHLPIFLLSKQINDSKVDTVIETRLYNEQATTTFKETSDHITWDEMYASKNPQESYSKFLNEILFIYNKSFPLIKKLSGLKSINHRLLWHL